MSYCDYVFICCAIAFEAGSEAGGVTFVADRWNDMPDLYSIGRQVQINSECTSEIRRSNLLEAVNRS